MRSCIIGFYLAVTIGLGVAAVSCAPLDAFFKKNPTTGQSDADKAAKSLTGLPPPWNEIVPGIILLAQNAYLGVRELKTRKKRKSDASKTPVATSSAS